MKSEPYLTKDIGSPFPTECYAQTFTVSFDYPVYFTNDLFHPQNNLLASVVERKNERLPHKIKVLLDSGIDQTTAGFQGKIKTHMDSYPGLKMEGKIEIVPGGEQAKNDWNLARHIMHTLADGHLCRHSYVLAIGGGSFLDIVGLAASLVHRGVRLIRVPSTVLSQNDAGVGVKNGIDEHGMKNFAGTFTPPFAVLNDFQFLRTLPEKYWTGGIAEAFKVAIIKDRGFFNFLCANAEKLKERDESAIEATIKRCAILHLEHIRTSGDPFEFGSARPLDFGHWSAHRLEVLSKHQIGHGRAVAIGIALDSCYAHRKGMVTSAERDSIIDTLEKTGLPIWDDLLEQKTPEGKLLVLKGLDDFQEHLGGQLNVTLPNRIGRKVEVHEMDAALIHEAIAYLKERSGHN